MSEETCPICASSDYARRDYCVTVRYSGHCIPVLFGKTGEQDCCDACLKDLDRTLQLWVRGMFRGYRNRHGRGKSFFTDEFEVDFTEAYEGSDD